MRFTDIDINFDVRYEGHQNCPKILSMNILSVFSDHHLWCQNWCQYLWTSLCQFNFFVNLLHSLGVSFFDIDIFWQLDIFLTTWHLLIFWEQIAHGPPYPMWLIPLYPIAHMAHTPCTPCAPIAHVPHTPVPQWASIAHMPHTLYPIAHTPCTPYPLWPYFLCAPIAHVPHTPYG